VSSPLSVVRDAPAACDGQPAGAPGRSRKRDPSTSGRALQNLGGRDGRQAASPIAVPRRQRELTCP
jgi:hypothetical protein